MMRSIQVVVVAVVLSFAGLRAQAFDFDFGSDSRSAAVDEMLDAFSQGCHMGPWTHSAIRRAQTLSAVLETLREKSTCSGMERSIAASQGLNSELQRMLDNGDFTNEKMWEEVVNDLSVSLQDPNLPPDVRAVLVDDYSYARFQLTQARAKVSAGLNPSGDQRLAQGMENVRNYLSALISDVDAISKCYADNPSAGMQIGTQILGLAGSFAPGLIGAGIQTLAKLLETGIVFARTMPISRSMHETKKSRMPVALTCGLEAFTREYCQAQDALELADLDRWPENRIDGFFYGVDLMERRLPILYGWLDKVVNGVQPVDKDHAAKIDEQFRLVNNANSMRRVAEGVFNEAQQKIDRGNTRERVLREALRALISGVFYHDPGGGNAVPRSQSPFTESPNAFLYSITQVTPPNTNEPYASYIDRMNLVNTQLDDLKRNLLALLEFLLCATTKWCVNLTPPSVWTTPPWCEAFPQDLLQTLHPWVPLCA